MRRVRSTDTAPELSFRRALDQARIAYEACASDLPGKPAIVVRSHKVAVFIDGDFWHGARWRNRKLTTLDEQFRRIKNRKYWLTKIRRNVEKDCERRGRSVLDNTGRSRLLPIDCFTAFPSSSPYFDSIRPNFHSGAGFKDSFPP
jgi:DNA mismatch endonuclease Vsr